MSADTLFYNGTLLTQDPAAPRAEALAVKGGRILAVGRLEDVEVVAGAGTRRYDLGGGTLIPAFNDAHVHVWKVGHLLTSLLDVRGVGSMAELGARFTDFAARLPAGAWVVGRGYNEADLAEKRHPTRADLDALFPDRPAYLIRTCAHIAVANTRALEVAGVTAQTRPPAGGVLDYENGRLEETALGLVANHIPKPSQADYEAMLIAAARHQLALGIASATDPGVLPEVMAAYRALEARGDLLNRVNVMAIRRPDGGSETLPLPQKYVSDFLRVDSIKFFADGGLSGATAAISQDYRHAATRGVLRLEAEELFDLAREAHQAGLRIATHAIGDVTIDLVLGVYARLWRELGAGQRHRIEHFGLASPAQARRAAAQGVIVVPQTIFLQPLGVNFRRYIPQALIGQCYPVRDMLAAGLTVALSSDAPVVKEDNPLLGMQAAILRRDATGELIAPEQAISAEAALYAYTMGGALASGDADNRGSLSVGKWADLALLSANPLEIPAEALSETRVLATWVGGRDM